MITAVAAGLDSITNIDYILLDEVFFDDAGIAVKHTSGQTADNVVSTEYHRDLQNLTAIQVRKLAEEIQRCSGEKINGEKKRMDRVNEKTVKNWVKEALKQGQLDFDAVRLRNKQDLQEVNP